MFYNGEEFFETPYKNYYVSKSGKLLPHTRLGILVKDKFFIDPYGYYHPAIVVEHKKQRRVFMHNTKEGVCMNLSIIQSSTTKADECKPVGDKPMIPQTVD